MSDYVKTTNFTAKDSLLTGDPAKIIKGSEHDAEYDAIATAVATKVDLAGAGLTISTKTVNLNWTGLTTETAVDVANDIVAVYDADAVAHRGIAVTYLTQAGLAARTLTTAATSGLSGGNTLDNDITLALNFNGMTPAVIASADTIAFYDADGAAMRAETVGDLATVLEGLMSHDDLTGFVANEHIDHSTVTLTAGTGLTGGGTITTNRQFDLDISGLTALSSGIAGTDGFLVDDNGVMKRISVNASHLPSRNVAASGNFASTDVGTIVYWTGTSGTLTMPTGIGQDDCFITVVNSGSGTLTIAGSGVTITSGYSLTAIPAGGVAVLIRETSTVWFLGGTLQ